MSCGSPALSPETKTGPLMLRRIPLVTMSLACLIVSGCCCCRSGNHGSVSGSQMARMFNSPIGGSKIDHPDHHGQGLACGEYSSCGFTDQYGCAEAWTCNAPQNYPCATCTNSCDEGCGDYAQPIYQHQAAPGTILQAPASPSAPQIHEPPMPVPAETPEDYTAAGGIEIRNIQQTNWASKDTPIMLPGNGVLQPAATPVLMVPAESL